MASRRYRAKNSLNSNISQVNAQVNKMGKRPAPRKLAENVVTSTTIQIAAVTTEALGDGAVDNKKLAVDAVATDNIRDGSVTEVKLATGLSFLKTVNASSDITAGTLSISRGGTGASSGSAALTSLGAAASTHTHEAADITDLSTAVGSLGYFASGDNADYNTLLLTSATNVSGGSVGGGSAPLRVGSDSGAGLEVDANQMNAYTATGAGANFYINGAGSAGNVYLGDGGGDTVISNSGTVGGNLVVDGSIIRSALNGDGLGSTGATITTGGALVRTSSSARYKTDIQPFEVSYEGVLGIKPKLFRLKDDIEHVGDKARIYAGVIAEDLAGTELDVFVSYRKVENGDPIPDGVHYAELTVALASAIKHQDSLIKSLTERIEALEAKTNDVL